MNISLNGEQTSTESTTLMSFLVEKSMGSTNGIAVAINEEVVPKSEWSEKAINENDKILIITATQGG